MIRVCVSPHGILHYLPFQCLVGVRLPRPKNNHKGGKTKNERRRKNYFLIEKYEIFYTPSASVLSFCDKKVRKDYKSVLAIGNPDSSELRKLGKLPYSEKEVKAIKKIIEGKGKDVVLAFRKNASESFVKRKCSGKWILHLACHGVMSSRTPLKSALLLAPSKYDDGFLYAYESYGLNLKGCTLVVLSACNTQIGKITTGGDIIAIFRGFLTSGSPSVIVTLWPVQDKSSYEFMAQFYKNLIAKNQSKLTALRNTQVWMIKRGRHPYYWSGYNLIGDNR